MLAQNVYAPATISLIELSGSVANPEKMVNLELFDEMGTLDMNKEYDTHMTA